MGDGGRNDARWGRGGGSAPGNTQNGIMRNGAVWERMERYARFRGRMHMAKLPCDVLDAMVQRHLGPEEVMCLGEAFAGEPLVWCRADRFVRAMPHWLRQTWLCALATLRAQRLVQQLETEAFWYATLSQRTRMHLDWSPHAARRRASRPVATFEWTHERPHAMMMVNGEELVQAVQRTLMRKSAVVQVALYTDGVWHAPAGRAEDGTLVFAFEHELLPPGAVRATYSSDALSPEALASAPTPRVPPSKGQIASSPPSRAPRRAKRRARPPPPPSPPPLLNEDPSHASEADRRQGPAGLPRRPRRLRRRS